MKKLHLKYIITFSVLLIIACKSDKVDRSKLNFKINEKEFVNADEVQGEVIDEVHACIVALGETVFFVNSSTVDGKSIVWDANSDGIPDGEGENLSYQYTRPGLITCQMCVDRVYCIQKYIHVKDAEQKEEDDNAGNSTQITTEGLQPNQSNVIQKSNSSSNQNSASNQNSSSRQIESNDEIINKNTPISKTESGSQITQSKYESKSSNPTSSPSSTLESTSANTKSNASSAKETEMVSKVSTPTQKIETSNKTATTPTAETNSAPRSSVVKLGSVTPSAQNSCGSWVKEGSFTITPSVKADLRKAELLTNSSGKIEVTFKGGGIHEKKIFNTVHGITRIAFIDLEAVDLQPGQTYTLSVKSLPDKEFNYVEFRNMAGCNNSQKSNPKISINYSNSEILFNLEVETL